MFIALKDIRGGGASGAVFEAVAEERDDDVATTPMSVITELVDGLGGVWNAAGLLLLTLADC